MKRLTLLLIALLFAAPVEAGIKYSYSPPTSSSSGDVEAVGDCTTGDCFNGTSGATLTFDTNGGTYGNDAIIAQDQTENYIKLSASGISDGGGNFSPLLYLQSLQTGTSALMLTRAQNGTMANFGAQGGGYLQMMHHPGTGTAGYGIMSYLTEIYPAYFNGNAATFAQSGYGVQSDNTMSFGTSGYRWANIYSVLGNFSGNLTLGTSGADETITFTDDVENGSIFFDESENAFTFTARGKNDAGTTNTSFTFQEDGTVYPSLLVKKTAASYGIGFGGDTGSNVVCMGRQSSAGICINGNGAISPGTMGSVMNGATVNNTRDLGYTGEAWRDIYLTRNLIIDTVGGGVKIKEGSNATMGLATLSSGTVVVSTTKVTANSRIFLTAQTLGTITVPVGLYVSARTASTSFTILSGNLTDTSTVAWMIVEPS